MADARSVRCWCFVSARSVRGRCAACADAPLSALCAAQELRRVLYKTNHPCLSYDTELPFMMPFILVAPHAASDPGLWFSLRRPPPVRSHHNPILSRLPALRCPHPTPAALVLPSAFDFPSMWRSSRWAHRRALSGQCATPPRWASASPLQVLSRF